MKLITLSDMIACPEGTVFTAYRPHLCTGLFKKLGNIDQKDFWYVNLLPVSDDEGLIEFGTMNGERWAHYDPNEQFVVWEADDVDLLAKVLEHSARFVVDVNADNFVKNEVANVQHP